MSTDEDNFSNKFLFRATYFLGTLGIIFIIFSSTRIFGSIFLLICLFLWLYKYFLKNQLFIFREKVLPVLENNYSKFLTYALSGIRPFIFLSGTFLLFIFSIVLMGVFPPKIEFFPDNEPQQILVSI